MELDKILLDLEVLNQIKQNDKLGIIMEPGSKKRIYVDQYSYLSGITRKYNGFNRGDTIDYIEELVNNIEKTSSIIISGNHIDYGETLIKAIEKSIIGLENLKFAYLLDSIIIARLILLIKKLQNITILIKTEILPLSFNDINNVEHLELNNEPMSYGEFVKNDNTDVKNNSSNC
tara:strand:- start:143 stop:667 length:525 start_codon:yes stop_codon:yes gene_type:complete